MKSHECLASFLLLLRHTSIQKLLTYAYADNIKWSYTDRGGRDDTNIAFDIFLENMLTNMNICIFGDSITWGAYDSEQGGWASRLRNYFETQDTDVDIYNLGISGDTTGDVLARIDVEAKARKTDVFVFAVGINDAQFIHSTDALRVPLEEFRLHLAKLLASARQYTDKVIFIGLTRVDESKTTPIPWYTDASYTNENIERLDSAIEKFCEENGLTYISMKDVVGNDDLVDGLHPNSKGHINMFEKIKTELNNI